MSHTTQDHPAVFWEEIPGVSRVHLPDQFVWTDWEDIETLGLFEIFMEYVEHAAGMTCKGKKGWISKKFDEQVDTQLFIGPKYYDDLVKKAGKCWSDKSKTQIGRL